MIATSPTYSSIPVYDSFAVFTPVAIPQCILPDNDDFGGLGPIFRMAKGPNVEAQVEGARCLCDLSTEEGMRQPLCKHGGLDVLQQLLSVDNEWAVHHAAIALANLSEDVACHENIINTKLLPLLSTLGLKKEFQFIELRLLSIHILSNLMSRHRAKVISAVGLPCIENWLTYDASTTGDGSREQLRFRAKHLCNMLGFVAV